MSIIDLLTAFADPSTLRGLSLGQKMMASLVTTLLGMGVTFLALIILQLVIELLARFCAAAPPPVAEQTAGAVGGAELAAAITAALAVMLDQPADRLVIRSIRKIEDPPSAWGRAGLVEQMHDRV